MFEKRKDLIINFDKLELFLQKEATLTLKTP